MTHLHIPLNQTATLPFYLAAEEWCARYGIEDEYFFMWRVAPTVICGRHQDMSAEVDIDYCRRNNIDVVRRRSGGGCVYADLNNYMISYVCRGSNMDNARHRFASVIVEALRKMGIRACVTGRNDIEINDAKVSGCAYYILNNHCIAHGTLLYDIDYETMSHAITPSRAKMISKGVHSVPARVGSLSGVGYDKPIESVERTIISSVCNSVYSLDEKDMHNIRTLESAYRDARWVEGKHRYNKSEATTHYIDGVGQISVMANVDSQGKVKLVDFSGDFFADDKSITSLCTALQGVAKNREAILHAVENTDCRQVILGLDNEMLVDLIIDAISNNT